MSAALINTEIHIGEKQEKKKSLFEKGQELLLAAGLTAIGLFALAQVPIIAGPLFGAAAKFGADFLNPSSK